MDDPLIFGREYHIYREGEYLGIATYQDDKNIGYDFTPA